ncbi:MAG: hypothetical protein KAJ57_12835 [Woeseiaceae bacterium]|nr:hypothetical protein [Woeseiaceae bacterium]
MNMWLPTPIYEKVPQFWLLLGLLFLSLGLYIGFDFEMIYFYLALGVVCTFRAFWIHLIRLRFRRAQSDPKNDNDESEPSDAATLGH